jgi:hypothetical protein
MAILYFNGYSFPRKPANFLALTAIMILRLHLSTFKVQHSNFLGVMGKFLRYPSKCPNLVIFRSTYSEIQALDDGMQNFRGYPDFNTTWSPYLRSLVRLYNPQRLRIG